jgi:hypothetical protein
MLRTQRAAVNFLHPSFVQGVAKFLLEEHLTNGADVWSTPPCKCFVLKEIIQSGENALLRSGGHDKHISEPAALLL